MKPGVVIGLLALLLLQLLPQQLVAEVFDAHCRQRPPVMVVAEQGCEGPGPALIERALGRLGHTVAWQTVPWARSVHMAKHGQVDLLPVHSMNEDREAYLLPVRYGERVRNIYYFTAADGDLQASTFDDLESLSIGALRGSFYSPEFNGARGLDVFYASSTQQLIDMLKLHRLDVAVTSTIHDLDHFLSDPDLRRLAYVEPVINGRYFSIPVTSPMAIHHPAIVRQVAAMWASGEIEAIYARYGVPSPLSDTNAAMASRQGQ